MEKQIPMSKLSIAIVMAVFNRKETTRRCIEHIAMSKDIGQFKIVFFITDDNSSDGTFDMLKQLEENYPDFEFNIFVGNGLLFWNKGMYRSYGEALKRSFDFYLWINDDVVFYDMFLSKLIIDSYSVRDRYQLYVICGSCCGLDEKTRSYGGLKLRNRMNPYKWNYVYPNGTVQKCDLVNGNCLVIPYLTAQKVGNLDNRYVHGMGDFDYGLKIRKEGGQAFVSSSYVGICERNSEEGTWRDPSLNIITRIRLKQKPTARPIECDYIYLRKWYPYSWPYYIIRPYLGIIYSGLKYKVSVWVNLMKKKRFKDGRI